ncbi:MAG TPA: glycoside hydrolase family 27 protein [Pyrinomonadaceae bacterium]|nr:glycoside hydrolase family 27 protein [Pyrinomonadaceae bacterium]
MAQAQNSSKVLAATPPMGWNSWDSFGRTLSEQTIKENAQWMATHLKKFGWEYVVVDEGWYLGNLDASGNAANSTFQMDQFGRYVPLTSRFPSAGTEATFRPLADYLHSLGLKFGLHIIRGIPREAVEKNLPIANSQFHASEAAAKTDLCPWNAYNYGLKPDHPAAQAYYDSVARLYADWQVDFIKIDCISDHPYKGEEIRMFAKAIKKSGRPMVLSLSPGPTNLSKRAEVSQYSQMWRISDDVWDLWSSTSQFPQGVKNQFERAAAWAGVAQPGRWPDADMLPIGSLRPAPGWGQPRETRLTHDEQRTMLTLWSIFRSPLIMGGNLSQADEWTTALLSNPEVIAVNQHSMGNRPVVSNENVVIWTARTDSGKGSYLAVFNISDVDQTVRYEWKDLGLQARPLKVRDLWQRKNLGTLKTLNLTLPQHACALYRL